MKLIHLSDLHLGKRLNEFPLMEDQGDILRKIVAIIKEEKPDGVLVAGDIYDRSVPSEEAMQLWDWFLVRMSRLGVPVYAISGNHDSAVRFADHNELIDAAGIHLSPTYEGEAAKYTLEDENGKLNIYLLPFIKPQMVRQYFPDLTINDYTDACRAAIEKMQVNTAERNILVAHQFVTGAARSESEEVTVGGLDNVNAEVFDCFDYVALGHIHGKQSIGRETIRYCGTPLKYSFSEKDQTKSVTVVEFGAKDQVAIREIPLKPLHDLREIRGTYEELMLKKNYEGTAKDDYLRVVLTDENDIPEAIGKLRQIYPNIMELAYDNKRTQSDNMISENADVEHKSPMELLAEFYEHLNNQPMSAEQAAFSEKCMKEIWGD